MTFNYQHGTTELSRLLLGVWFLLLFHLLLCSQAVISTSTIQSDNHDKRNITIEAVVPVPNIPSSQLDILQDLYDSTDGKHWIWIDPTNPLSIPWNFTEPDPNPCIDNWEGVTCNKECVVGLKDAYCVVTELDLESHNLNGTLPDSFGKLTTLQWLSLADNRIRGYIPRAWNTLVNVTSFDLSGNIALTGTVPDDMFHEWHQLMLIDLSKDSLYGSLPSSLFETNTLKYLDLSVNAFNGSISDSLCLLTQLQYLYFDYNQLTGIIPYCIGDIRGLIELVLLSNALTYSLPNTVTNMKSLETLALSDNRMYGTIPENISECVNLSTMSLELNLFEGRIPDSIYKLHRLDILELSANLLVGHVPNISTSTALSVYSIEYNFLYGRIEHLNMSRMLALVTEHNFLTGPLPPYINESRKAVSTYDIEALAQISPVITRDSIVAAIEFISANDNYTGNLFFYTNVSANYFTGPVPTWIFTCPILSYVYMFDNMLTGTIPDVSLDVIITSNNASSLLGILYLDTNHLIGTIPQSIIQQRNLKNLRLANNRFTGTIPGDLLLNNQNSIIAIEFENNAFSGTLPLLDLTTTTATTTAAVAATATTVKGGKGELREPSPHFVSFPELKILSLGNNYLTGPLYPDFSTFPNLVLLAISTNCFTGTIPESVCDMKLISELIMDGLSAADHCQQKIFPQIPGFTSFVLQHGMDGSIPACLYEMPLLGSMYLSGNLLSGTIPKDLNMSHSLLNLRLSYNQLSGTIPTVLQKKSWQILDLSYNRFKGTLYSELFDHDTIDGKDIGSDSGLTDDSVIVEEFEKKQELYLDVNRLSGAIPSTLLDIPTISILNENMFYCDLSRKQLPSNDPKSNTYTCASDSMYQALLGWFVFWMILLTVMGLIKLRVGNIYQSIYLPMKKSLQEWNRAFELADHRLMELLKRNRHITPLCASSMVSLKHVFVIAKRFFTMLQYYSLGIGLLSICIFMPVYRILNIYQSVFENKYAWEYSAIYMSGLPAGIVLFNVFCSMLIATFMRFHRRFQALIPMNYIQNAGNGQQKRTSKNMIVTTKSTIVTDLSHLSFVDDESIVLEEDEDEEEDNRDRSNKKESEREEQQGNQVFRRSSVETTGTTTERRTSATPSTSRIDSVDTMTIIRESSFKSVFTKVMSPNWSWVRFVVVAGLNVFCMTLVNIAYVIIIVYVDYRGVIILSQLVLAMTKIWWNEIFIWHLVKSTKALCMDYRVRFLAWKEWFVAWVDRTNNGNGNTNNPSPSTRPTNASRMTEAARSTLATTVKGKDQFGTTSVNDDNLELSSNDVFLIVCCLLFNNIIAPSLGVSIVSPACFYNAFYAANPITASYIYCTTYVRINTLTGAVCTQEITSQTSFSPPFIYSYTCSSLLPVSYVTVYLYMLLFSGFVIPSSKLILKYVYDHMVEKDGVWYKRLQYYVIPFALAELYPDPENLPSHYHMLTSGGTDSDGNVLLKVKPLFDKNRFVVRCIGFLTLLISFGVVFPPLGFVAALAVVFVTLFEQYNLGRILFQAEQVGYSWYLLKLAQDFEGIAESFVSSVFPMGMVACLLFAAITFDTFGDARGAKYATAPTIATLFLPLFVWMVVQTNWRRLWQSLIKNEPAQSPPTRGNGKQRVISQNKGLEMRKSTAPPSLASGINPIHRSSALIEDDDTTNNNDEEQE